MEIRYDIKTLDYLSPVLEGWVTCVWLDNQLTIHNACEELVKFSIGKDINLLLQQLYVWGHMLEVKVSIISITEELDILFKLEKMLGVVEKVDDRKWMQLWTGTGFTYFPYRTLEEKKQILEDCKDMFYPVKEKHNVMNPLGPKDWGKQPNRNNVKTLLKRKEKNTFNLEIDI